ncbi:Regulator of G protein signaling domain [Popillia japonica]|uniref:Regulator of G protein signaling domain n=1 Tax=Popillia japonica TaxID=7064 RepID=A0AAW1L7Q3_POPJA
MLHFWKKSVVGQKNNSRSNSSSPTKSTCSNASFGYSNGSKTTSFEGLQAAPALSLEDEGLFDTGDIEFHKERSRLSKCLKEVLLDKSALGYFVQYLDSRNGLPYIRCWLDIENFRSAVDLFFSKTDHDSLSVSTDCDSYTADSTSLHDSCTGNVDVKTDKKTENSDCCDKDCSDISPKLYLKNGLRLGCSDKSLNTIQNKFVEEFTDDALTIFKKYVALEAPESVNSPENIRKDIIENICNSNKLMSNCFDKVQKHVYDILDRDYFEAFLGSDYFCKYQIDVLTSGNVVLDDILYNETALFYFMEFLEQESNRNLLEFWLAATNFHQQLHNQKEFVDPVEAQNDAVVLYDKYFSLQAHCPLGFGDKVRFAVEQNICDENGLLRDCFEVPLKIVEQVLERNYLKPFLASQLFYKYLSELINAVQSSGYSTMFERKRCLSSDCSSEKSFSTNSTFLAMENPNRKVKKTPDMNIDTRQLYDPDSLWKRKKHHRLSFGRVTELGKFETDFEPEPDKKLKSKLRNVVKRFVNLDEDKRKEEMAWQVAEMIVKDITNVTLNDHKY